MKWWKAAAIAALAFSAGAYLAGGFETERTEIAPQNGFYQQPYNLRILYIERNGKVETYLVDKVTKEYGKVGEKLECKQEEKGSIDNKVDTLMKIYGIIGFM